MRNLIANNKLFKSKEYSLDDIIFFYTIYLALTVIGSNIFINIILDIPLFIQVFNIFIGILVLFIYWLAYYKKKIKPARILLLAIIFFAINVTWIETQGSAGPSIVFLMAMIPLIVFFSPRRAQTISLIILSINVVALFILESFYPEIITKYESDSQRSFDLLSVMVIFLIFEIPLLQFAKESMLKERNQALQSEERKTSMIANLSHEIRTPMNAILGFTELLGLPDVPKDEQKKYLEVIGQNGKILFNLLNNIINHSKLESKQVTTSISTINAIACMEQVHDSLLPAAQLKPDVQFSMNFDKNESVTIESDHTLLFQILTNLTFNALKFTSKGHVTLAYTLSERHLIFRIKDSGMGISNKLKPFIFKQFRKGEAEEQHLPMQGAGLGLAICQGLTNILKGDIWFESEENMGTEFFLSLPLVWSE
ncbi:sensor histidine kinase [Carboxylicivirga sp. N1Y90]|uniref:sensor histidine kinase n=1 Tax=Carboxylicivirga fragile TaxID=3417571 RepID=UPI003D33468F|nr:hypothetical protein [Marinilabiliaceae bacterium N1Y90]